MKRTVIISSPKTDCEEKLVGDSNYNVFVANAQRKNKWSDLSDTDKENDYLLFLLNPGNSGNTNVTTDEATKLLEWIEGHLVREEVILYLHNTDNLRESSIRSHLDGIGCACTIKSFSHQGERHPYIAFMNSVIQDYGCFDDAYATFVRESLKTAPSPHVIAFLILCVGFIAANSADLAPHVSIDKERIKYTLTKEWWNPIADQDNDLRKWENQFGMVKAVRREKFKSIMQNGVRDLKASVALVEEIEGDLRSYLCSL